jgi:hypothetical protein
MWLDYKLKTKKYQTAGTFPRSNIKIVERVTIDTHRLEGKW